MRGFRRQAGRLHWGKRGYTPVLRAGREEAVEEDVVVLGVVDFKPAVIVPTVKIRQAMRANQQTLPLVADHGPPHKLFAGRGRDLILPDDNDQRPW